MKKLNVLTRMLLLVALLVGSTSVCGQVVFDFQQDSEAYGWTGGTPAGGDDGEMRVGDEFVNGSVKFIYSSAGEATTGLRWWNTTDGIRVYTKKNTSNTNQFKIKCTAGEISKIVIVGTLVLSEVSSTGGTISSSRTWTAPASGGVTEVEFKGTHTSGNKNIKSVTVHIVPSSATDNGDGTISLTTTDNMAGWRAFYPAGQGYTLDASTKAYIITTTPSDGKATLVELAGNNGDIPGNTPVILHTSSSADSHKMTLTKKTVDNYSGATNLLKVTDGTKDVSEKYRLGYNSTDGVGFYPYSETKPVAGTIYLDASSATSAKGLTFVFDDDETDGIKAVSTKVENGVRYNLAGQKVGADYKGIVIVNGKKMFNK